MVQVEVLLHTRDEGVGDVRRINLDNHLSTRARRMDSVLAYPFGQHPQGAKGQQGEVQLRMETYSQNRVPLNPR